MVPPRAKMAAIVKSLEARKQSIGKQNIAKKVEKCMRRSSRSGTNTKKIRQGSNKKLKIRLLNV